MLWIEWNAFNHDSWHWSGFLFICCFFYVALPYHVSIIFCLDSQCETLKWPLNFSCHTFLFNILLFWNFHRMWKILPKFFWHRRLLMCQDFFYQGHVSSAFKRVPSHPKEQKCFKRYETSHLHWKKKKNWSDFLMYWLEIHCWHMNLCHWLHYVMLNKYIEEDSAEVKNNNSCECLSTTVVQ